MTIKSKIPNVTYTINISVSYDGTGTHRSIYMYYYGKMLKLMYFYVDSKNTYIYSCGKYDICYLIKGISSNPQIIMERDVLVTELLSADHRRSYCRYY